MYKGAGANESLRLETTATKIGEHVAMDEFGAGTPY